MRACATGSPPPASSSMRSTRRRSAPGSRTSTPPGRTSWGRSAGRSWRRRLGNWGSPRSPHGATARGRVMRGQPCQWHGLPRISRSLSSGRPTGSGLWPARWQAPAGPGGSIRATGLALFCAVMVLRGAAIDARDLNGATALYTAAESERPTTVAALLAKGADPNLTGRSDVSPLAAAAFRGNDRIVELLLSRGADPDHVDATGKTPLIYAAARGFALVVRRLLDAGADAKARYGNDLTVLMWAAGHEDGVGAAAAIAVVALLIAPRAAIDAADNPARI